MGITKLQLLSVLPSDQAEDILKNNDLENMTVKEIKKVVKGYDEPILDVEVQTEETAFICDEPISSDVLSPSLGSYIRLKREEKGLSPKAAAILLAISVAHLCNIERGVKIPSRSLTGRIIDVLELDTEEANILQTYIDKQLVEHNRLPADVIELLLANPGYLDTLRKKLLIN